MYQKCSIIEQCFLIYWADSNNASAEGASVKKVQLQ